MSEEVDFLSGSTSDGSKREDQSKKQKEKHVKGVRVNLVTREILKATRERIEKKNVKKIGISVSAALACAALAYAGVLIYGQLLRNNLIPLSRELKEINNTIADIERTSNELITFQNKLVAIKSLFDDHVYWTAFFKNLEETTLPEVIYTSIAISPDMTATLAGAATNYTTLGRQYLAFQRATSFTSSTEISGASAVLDSEGRINGVNFTITLKVNPQSIKAPSP